MQADESPAGNGGAFSLLVQWMCWSGHTGFAGFIQARLDRVASSAYGNWATAA